MNLALILSGAALGLASGGHCIAMCGAGSSYILGARAELTPRATTWRLGSFHAGRIAAYACVGTVLGGTATVFHVLTEWAGVLRPLWTMANTVMFLLGACLLITARQPQMLARIGDAAGQWLRRGAGGSSHAIVFHRRSGVAGGVADGRAPSTATPAPGTQERGGWRGLAAGLSWAFIPCGPLYSAWTLALFAGDPLSGALTAAAFASVSGAQLGLAQWWLARFGGRREKRAEQGGGWDKLGVRVAGAALCLSAGYAIAMLAANAGGAGWFCL